MLIPEREIPGFADKPGFVARQMLLAHDRKAYKRRNLIERCVNRLKQFRRIATRYEKTARAYLSMLSIAAAETLD